MQNLEKGHYNYIYQLIYLDTLPSNSGTGGYAYNLLYLFSYDEYFYKLVNKMIVPLDSTKLVELHPFTLRIYSTSLTSNIINNLNHIDIA